MTDIPPRRDSTFLTDRKTLDDDEYFPPSASSTTVMICGNQDCQHVHMVLYDEFGQGIAQCTIDQRIADNINKALASVKNGNR